MCIRDRDVHDTVHQLHAKLPPPHRSRRQKLAVGTQRVKALVQFVSCLFMLTIITKCSQQHCHEVRAFCYIFYTKLNANSFIQHCNVLINHQRNKTAHTVMYWIQITHSEWLKILSISTNRSNSISLYFICFNRTILVSVSYTHLDVYKRQTFDNGDPIAAPCNCS